MLVVNLTIDEQEQAVERLMVRTLTKNALGRTCSAKPYDWIKLSQEVKLISLVVNLQRSSFALAPNSRNKQNKQLEMQMWRHPQHRFAYI